METQNESASNGRNVDTLHNQDKVFKESFTLFKGGSLDFLDKELTGEVTDILSTEITETTTKKSYSDNALKLSTNIGIHNEWESQVSEDDLMRFGSYNLDLCFLQFNSVANINQSGEKRKRVKRGALEKAPMHHPQLFLANMPFSQGRVVFFASKKSPPFS